MEKDSARYSALMHSVSEENDYNYPSNRILIYSLNGKKNKTHKKSNQVKIWLIALTVLAATKFINKSALCQRVTTIKQKRYCIQVFSE